MIDLRRLCAGWIASGVMACDSDYAPIEIDVSANCNALRAEPIAPASGFGDDAPPWSRIGSVLDAGPGLDIRWAVVQPLGQRRLVVWQWRDGELEHEIPIAVPVERASELELRIGASPAEAWLEWAAPSTYELWRLDARVDGGLVGASGPIAGFPPDVARCDEDGDGEPNEICNVGDWSRHLGFIGEDAYVIALPDSSPDDETHVYLGKLNSTLAPGPTTDLVFLPRCRFADPQSCPPSQGEQRFPALTFIDASRDGRLDTHAFMFFRDVASGAVKSPGSDVVLVILRKGEGDEPSGFSISLNEDPTGIVPVRTTTTGLAVDETSVYVQYSTSAGYERLFSLSVLDFLPRLLEVDIPAGMGLVQLDRDIALSRLDARGRLEVLKLFPEAPEASQTFVYEPKSPARQVDEAGLGAFVLRNETDEVELVRLRCERPGSL